MNFKSYFPDYKSKPVVINVYDPDEIALLQIAEEICHQVSEYVDESIQFTLSLLEWNDDS